ncbi:MAG: hypothetical protein VB142_00275 [Burkholderia sp.]
MLFNEKLKASGNLFRVSDDLLLGENKLWVGGIKLDDKELIVASAVPRFRQDRLDRYSLDGFLIALGTTDPACHGLGYYAEVSPAGPLPGGEMTGFLKHREQKLDDVFHVCATYATNADGTSRLDVTIESIIEQLERDREEHEREIAKAQAAGYPC